ncbi:UvrD-helicase domain-containing protein [Leptospira ellisii]|uniref:RecBCD enzyme subunit RecB n=1 Tax=Leptospira ellisii TaxID=2023197 RepID=A0AAE4TZ14_9LEPT|nr:UvrD-helicase domain-containing protein [Leptospira ellisii]MDV6236704.1 UvrD-helicase domain-containing protein [Leptospira ellisii]
MTSLPKPFPLKSCFVEASAGTGKTYTIMEIVGDLILHHRIPLTEILILTYTEKAAGELKERLRKKLIRSGLNKEARELDQVTISTIHGFCNMILQEYPVETGTSDRWILTDAKERMEAALYEIQHGEWKGLVPSDRLKSLLSESEYLKQKEKILEAGTKLLGGKEYPYNDDDSPFDENNFLQKTALAAKKSVEIEFETGEWMTYDQMILKTVKALENPHLKQALYDRYKVGILDEFQDTDPNQYNIFLTLFLERTAEGRALYLIGDPKQSIYGFRGADIGTYLRAKSDLKGFAAENVSLNVNYRSVPELIRAYNVIFSGEIGEKSFFPIFETGFESRPIEYAEVTPPGEDAKILLSESHTEGPVHIVDFQGKEFWKADEYRTAWSKFAAEEILKLCEGDAPFRYRIRDEDGSELHERILNYDEIAVLVKSKAEGKLVEQTLKLSGIPCSFYKQEGIYQSPESIQISNILECLLDPNKPSSYRKLLLGDLFRIHPDRLTSFDEHSIDSYEKSVLDRWKKLASERKFAELFRSVEEDSRIFLTEEKTDIDWERKRTNYRQIFRKLLQFQISNQSGLEEVLQELNRLQTERKNEEELPLFERETEKKAVQILTLHASKGLEWPVVFLFHLSGNFIPDVYEYPAVDENGRRIWKLNLWDGNEEEKAAGKTLYSFNNLNENKRLLYVGITRPKARLYLPFFTPANHPKTRDSAYYKILYPRLKAVLDNDPDPTLFRRVVWSPKSADQMRTENRATETHNVRLSPLLLKHGDRHKTIGLHSYSSIKTRIDGETDSPTALEESPFLKSDEAEDFPSTFEDPLPSSAAAGSFLHLILEESDFARFRETEPKEILKDPNMLARIDEHLDYYRLLPQNARNAESELEKRRRRAVEIVWNALNARIPLDDGSTFRLSDLSEDKRVAEMDFHFDLDPARKTAGNFLKGSIDLVFETAGRFYLADYKSNLLEDYSSASLRNAVESQDARYDLQRDIYAMILHRYLVNLFGKEEALERTGGVFYLFLRGMKAGESTGIYHDFDWSAQRLDQIFESVQQLTDVWREAKL